MLTQIMALFRHSQGAPLTAALISRQLQLAPDLVEQLLRTLVQRGRLVMVEACADCAACPLHGVCAGTPPLPVRGYALAPGFSIMEGGNRELSGRN